MAGILFHWQAYAGFRQWNSQVWRRLICNRLAWAVGAAAYPVLVLVWFSRGAVRRHMGAWRTPAGRERSKPCEPVWPTVLGVLAAFWGATGLLSATLSLAGSILAPWPDGGIVRWLLEWGPAVLGCLSAALAVLSMVWGVLLLRRRRAAVRWCRTYAVCSLALCVATPALMVAAGSFGPSGHRLDIAIRTAGSTVVGMVWPIFLLVWFAHPKIRAQVKAWPARGSQTLQILD